MVTFLVLFAAGILLGTVLTRLLGTPVPAAELVWRQIAHARPGDSFRIAGAGDGGANVDFTADQLIHYDAGTRRWSEWTGRYLDRRVALRLTPGPDQQVDLQTDTRELTLHDLGLVEEDLTEMDERKNPADSFEFDGKVWLYRLSREVRSAPSDRAVGPGFYYWEFQEHNGKQRIGIRKGQGEPFRVMLYNAVPPNEVSVRRGNLRRIG